MDIQYPMLSWETLHKAYLWADEEWGNLRIALARPVKVPAVRSSNGEWATTIWLNEPHDGADGHAGVG